RARPRPGRGPRRLRAVRGGRARLGPAGRWALLRAGSDAGAEAEPMRFARQLLRRWGVVVRELVARESRMPPWRVVLGALRTLEARGEIRGGRFVAGLVGEQFALPEAVEALRAVRRGAQEPETVVVAAADPLNLVGVLVPGARLSPMARLVHVEHEHPFHASSVNALGGAPGSFYRLLDDSNQDWGQGLKALARWQRERDVPRITLLSSLLVDGADLLAAYGVAGEASVRNTRPLFFPEPGKTYAVSAHLMARGVFDEIVTAQDRKSTHVYS